MRKTAAKLALVPTLLLAMVGVHVSLGHAHADVQSQASDPCGDREARGQWKLSPQSQLIPNDQLRSAVDLAVEESIESLRSKTGIVTTGSRVDDRWYFRKLTHKYVQDVDGNWRNELIHRKENLPYWNPEHYSLKGLASVVEYWDAAGQEFLRPMNIKNRNVPVALEYLAANQARWTSTTSPMLDKEDAYHTPIDALPDLSPYDGNYLALSNGGARYEFTQCWIWEGTIAGPKWAKVRTVMEIDSSGRVSSVSQSSMTSPDHYLPRIEANTNFEYPSGGAQVGIPSVSSRVPWEKFRLAMEASYSRQKTLAIYDEVRLLMMLAFGSRGDAIPPEYLPLGRWQVMNTLKEAVRQVTGRLSDWRVPVRWAAKGDVLQLWIIDPYSKKRFGVKFINTYDPKRANITVKGTVT